MNDVILTAQEIANIEHGLFDLSSVGEDVVVPFHAHKLRKAGVVWINERWFLERRIDISDQQVRARLDQWLIDEFAFVVRSDGDDSSGFLESTKTFFADSYGSSDAATHGGSGRVGISGRFQVKGVGKTPLVGAVFDWLHSHGCLWLEEALREAVYAEISANEFPHGAVPVLAVIDTGLRHIDENGQWGERRGLTVRPVVVRPAYFERAILFQPPGEEHAARKRDVRRVKQVVQYFQSLYQPPEELPLTERFAQAVISIAQQIAFSRAHRLFPGNYASSNVDIEGALLDFGPFRALPNWCRSISMNNVEGFGNEIVEITEFIKSITFYVNKYSSPGSDALNSDELLQDFSKELDQAFARELLYLFHLEEAGDDEIKKVVLSTLFEYYRMQQCFEVRFENSCKQKLNWLGDVFLTDEKLFCADSAEGLVWATLDSTITTSQLEADSKAILLRRMRATAARLLPTRFGLLRESLAASLNSVIAEREFEESSEPFRLDDIVNGIISRNRRHWPFVPRNLIVLAQYSNLRCAVLYCVDPENDQYFLWLEAASLGDHIWSLDKWVARTIVDTYTHINNGNWWFGLFPASCFSPEIKMAEFSLRLPYDAIWFNEHAEVGTAGFQHNERVNYA